MSALFSRPESVMDVDSDTNGSKGWNIFDSSDCGAWTDQPIRRRRSLSRSPSLPELSQDEPDAQKQDMKSSPLTNYDLPTNAKIAVLIEDEIEGKIICGQPIGGGSQGLVQPVYCLKDGKWLIRKTVHMKKSRNAHFRQGVPNEVWFSGLLKEWNEMATMKDFFKTSDPNVPLEESTWSMYFELIDADSLGSLVDELDRCKAKLPPLFLWYLLRWLFQCMGKFVYGIEIEENKGSQTHSSKSQGFLPSAIAKAQPWHGILHDDLRLGNILVDFKTMNNADGQQSHTPIFRLVDLGYSKFCWETRIAGEEFELRAPFDDAESFSRLRQHLLELNQSIDKDMDGSAYLNGFLLGNDRVGAKYPTAKLGFAMPPVFERGAYDPPYPQSAADFDPFAYPAPNVHTNHAYAPLTAYALSKALPQIDRMIRELEEKDPEQKVQVISTARRFEKSSPRFWQMDPTAWEEKYWHGVENKPVKFWDKAEWTSMIVGNWKWVVVDLDDNNLNAILGEIRNGQFVRWGRDTFDGASGMGIDGVSELSDEDKAVLSGIEPVIVSQWKDSGDEEAEEL